MWTRCPHVGCRAENDLGACGEYAGTRCPACGRAFTARPLDLIERVEREHRLRKLRAGQDGSWACRGDPPLFSALLDDVRSLHNVGSIFRTADGAGFAAVHLCGITGCPPDPALAKTSLGAEQTVAWHHWSTSIEAVSALRGLGIRIVALERTGSSRPLSEALAQGRLGPPVCLAVGNEVRGLSVEVLEAADVTCHLPMRGAKESLNVSVAFGIAAYEVRQALEPTLH